MTVFINRGSRKKERRVWTVMIGMWLRHFLAKHFLSIKSLYCFLKGLFPEKEIPHALECIRWQEISGLFSVNPAQCSLFHGTYLWSNLPIFENCLNKLLNRCTGLQIHCQIKSKENFVLWEGGHWLSSWRCNAVRIINTLKVVTRKVVHSFVGLKQRNCNLVKIQ